MPPNTPECVGTVSPTKNHNVPKHQKSQSQETSSPRSLQEHQVPPAYPLEESFFTVEVLLGTGGSLPKKTANSSRRNTGFGVRHP